MAYQKLIGQCTRALEIIPSDRCDIPYIGNLIVDDKSDNPGSGVPGVLEDASGDFINKGVKVGDIIYNYTTRGGGIVREIVSATELVVNFVDFSGASQVYKIFSSEGGLGIGGHPAFVFSSRGPGSANQWLTTAGGDLISQLAAGGAARPGYNIGSFSAGAPWRSLFCIPFQVTRFWQFGNGGTVDNINEYWIAAW